MRSEPLCLPCALSTNSRHVDHVVSRLGPYVAWIIALSRYVSPGGAQESVPARSRASKSRSGNVALRSFASIVGRPPCRRAPKRPREWTLCRSGLHHLKHHSSILFNCGNINMDLETGSQLAEPGMWSQGLPLPLPLGLVSECQCMSWPRSVDQREEYTAPVCKGSVPMMVPALMQGLLVSSSCPIPSHDETHCTHASDLPGTHELDAPFAMPSVLRTDPRLGPSQQTTCKGHTKSLSFT